MKYLVKTQAMENYGAQNGGGKYAEEGKSYWKFKFGDEYIIEGASSINEAVAFVAALSMRNNIGIKEFPCHWEEVADDYMTGFEKSQLEYDGEIVYPAKRINIKEYFKKDVA